MRRAVPSLLTLFVLVLAAMFLVAGCSAGTRGLRLRLAPEAPPTSEATKPIPDQLVKTAPRQRSEDTKDLFNAGRALADTKAIAAFGSRPGGSEAERQAAEFIASRLTQMGYSPHIQTFDLPNGTASRNVIAVAPGASSRRRIIIGAHFDTKPPSPGANDNASGCAVALELARILKSEPIAAEVLFVFYGTEEFLVDAPGDNHHLGSRAHAASLSRAELGDTAAMISIDMVGYGSKFHVRTMRKGPQSLSDRLLAEARNQRVGLTFEKDLGKTGWSDHEPYELRGVPSVWLQWQDDPTYHTAKDDGSHVLLRPIDVTGEFVLRALRNLDDEALEKLCDR